MLNFLEVKELRSYRSRWSLGVKPLVLSIGYKRNNIWLNSLTTNYYPYLRKLSNFLLDYHRFQFSIFKVVKEQGIALERRFALVLNLNAEFDFGLYCATQVGNRSKVGNEAY